MSAAAVALAGTAGASLLLPLCGAVIAATRLDGVAAVRRVWAVRCALLSFGTACAAAVIVAVHGGRLVTLTGAPVASLLIDPLTVSLLLLTTGLGAVVQSFARRYLRIDPRAQRFFVGSGLVVTGTGLLEVAGTLPLLTVGWVMAGVAFVATQGYHRGLPDAVPAMRRTLWRVALGDLALVAAVTVATCRYGLSSLVPGRGHAWSGSVGALVAVLVLAAALSRSAQVPFAGWLPGTVVAPTPVSALLHAGVVNGGAILLLRTLALSPRPVLVAALSFGGVTAVTGAVLGRRRPDVKGKLAFSTMSQMGFLVAEVATGATVAAVAHLLGHAVFKAGQFFGAGSRIPSATAPTAPKRPGRTGAGALAVGVLAAGASAALMISLGHVTRHPGGTVLLLAGVLAAGWFCHDWWQYRPATNTVTGVALFTVAALLASAVYSLALDGLDRWLSGALPRASTPSPVWLLGIVAAVAVAMAGPVARLLLPVAMRLSGDRPPRHGRAVAGTIPVPGTRATPHHQLQEVA